jgi:hypothetical protein
MITFWRFSYNYICCCRRYKSQAEVKPDKVPEENCLINELDLLYNKLELHRETSSTIYNSIKQRSVKLKINKSEKTVNLMVGNIERRE